MKYSFISFFPLFCVDENYFPIYFLKVKEIDLMMKLNFLVLGWAHYYCVGMISVFNNNSGRSNFKDQIPWVEEKAIV